MPGGTRAWGCLGGGAGGCLVQTTFSKAFYPFKLLMKVLTGTCETLRSNQSRETTPRVVFFAVAGWVASGSFLVLGSRGYIHL